MVNSKATDWFAPEPTAGKSFSIKVEFFTTGFPLEKFTAAPVTRPDLKYLTVQLSIKKVAVKTCKPPPYSKMVFLKVAIEPYSSLIPLKTVAGFVAVIKRLLAVVL